MESQTKFDYESLAFTKLSHCQWTDYFLSVPIDESVRHLYYLYIFSIGYWHEYIHKDLLCISLYIKFPGKKVIAINDELYMKQIIDYICINLIGTRCYYKRDWHTQAGSYGAPIFPGWRWDIEEESAFDSIAS